ncbi:hypothetical protein FN846DRAFT_911606 [Sphaerosporella brunnea]|uniref:Uncharacterized protein n=1 Tax=Sphaerosporella brunnea TaxID=1250544 RepID=A0A5J5EK48_9PEZI|nr:hypothetical protein FN846DRAFT_911606 [Sphaerosporella brunnea]
MPVNISRSKLAAIIKLRSVSLLLDTLFHALEGADETRVFFIIRCILAFRVSGHAAVYYIFEHDAQDWDDEECFLPDVWIDGKIRHAFDLATWMEKEECLPACCKSVLLNTTPVKKEDPPRDQEESPVETKDEEQTATRRGRSHTAARKAVSKPPPTANAGAKSRVRSTNRTTKKQSDMAGRILEAFESFKKEVREDVREQFAAVDDRISSLDDRISTVQTQVSLITHHLIEEQYECTQE